MSIPPPSTNLTSSAFEIETSVPSPSSRMNAVIPPPPLPADSHESVPEPSVCNCSPASPSSDGIVYATPLIVRLLPLTIRSSPTTRSPLILAPTVPLPPAVNIPPALNGAWTCISRSFIVTTLSDE